MAGYALPCYIPVDGDMEDIATMVEMGLQCVAYNHHIASKYIKKIMQDKVVTCIRDYI